MKNTPLLLLRTIGLSSLLLNLPAAINSQILDQNPEKPNIILIMGDDMGFSNL